MTLLIAAAAASVCTIIWYTSKKARELKIGTLCLMFWGASLMWLVDAVVEYLKDHESYFTPTASDMLNDAFLGLSVVVLGVIIWLVMLLISDPKEVIKNALKRKE